MTGILLAAIAGIAMSGGTLSDIERIALHKQAVTILVEQQQRELEKEASLEETIVEGFIHRLGTLRNTKHRAGRFDINANAFDCSGLFKAYAFGRGIINEAEAVQLNSSSLYLFGKAKALHQAKRGDITYWQPIAGDPRQHIAIVTRSYNAKEGGLWILDNIEGTPKERFLHLRGDVYLGKWKIKIATNPLVEIAKTKGLEFQPLRNYEGYFNLSRYYSPMPGQTNYFLGSYEDDLKMNVSGDPLMTASGKRLTPKDVEKVVACPPEYPLGTKLRVEDWFTVRCEDRGGSIKGRRLDIRAGIGQDGYTNIAENKVVTGNRHIYKFTYLTKPINESNGKRIFVTNSSVGYMYR